MACLAQVFENEAALDRLEGFTSLFGPAFYGLDPNTDKMTLLRQNDPVQFPDRIETGAGPITVFDPGINIHWKVSH